MLTPQQKRIILSQYFFFNEFLEGNRDRKSFLELLWQFNSNLISDGFSQQEIDEMSDRVKKLVLIPKAKIPVERVIPSEDYQNFLQQPWKKDVDTFVRQAREYLYNGLAVHMGIEGKNSWILDI